jgi:hypothetical protein
MEDISDKDTDKEQNDSGEDMAGECRSRSSSSGDEAWMLIEVEKYQDALDESFLHSTVLQETEGSSSSSTPLEPVVDEDDGVGRKEGEVEEQDSAKDDFDSLSNSGNSHHVLFSSNNSHSSVESSSSHPHSHPHTTVCQDGTISEGIAGAGAGTAGLLRVNIANGCDNSINASEMLRDYFLKHHGNTPAASYGQDLLHSEDDEIDDEGGDVIDMEALQLALQKAEDEAELLREKTHSLLLKNQHQDTMIKELLQFKEESQKQAREEELQDQEQREQMKLLEKSVSCTTHTAPGATAQLVISLRGVYQRIRNLERETRQVRLVEEQRLAPGGVTASSKGTGSELGAGRNMRMLEEEEEKGDDVLLGLVSRLGEQLSGLENELIPLVSRMLAPETISDSTNLNPASDLTTSHKGGDDLKISLKSFAVNDIALFFPTPKGEYLAFNIGSPHHFLSAESKALIGQDAHFKKLYVLGRIVMTETLRVEGPTTPAGDPHPKGLARGVQYHALSVTSVADQLA